MVGGNGIGSRSITTSETASRLVASTGSVGAGASGSSSEKSTGASRLPDSRCFAVRGVNAPGRRQIVFAREMPPGELGSSVRGSTGPCRAEPLDLATPLFLEVPVFGVAGLGVTVFGGLTTPPPPVRDPARLDVWGTPLSTRRSVGGAT